MKLLRQCIISVFMIAVMLFGTITAEAGLVKAVPSASVQNTIYRMIEKQNFAGSRLTNNKAKAFAKHFLTVSKWRPGQKFPYTNEHGVYAAGTISDGTYKTKVGKNTGCYRYSCYISNVVYGKTGSRKYFTAKKGKLAANVAKFKELIKTQAQFGEHIRINNKHSMTFLGCDENGMYVIEYCNPGKIAYQYRTYKSFCEEYNNVKPEKGKNYAVWIYNACTAVNSTKTTSTAKASASSGSSSSGSAKSGNTSSGSSSSGSTSSGSSNSSSNSSSSGSTNTVTTKTGYVLGTDGSLAINSKAESGNMIAAIPEGAAVTYYPSKTVGKWYYVTYGGKSGYSYSTYITDSQPATRTGTVKGTDGSLNIRATASTSGTKRGTIPEGKSCTVFIDKKSGSWIWIKYGNVAGWASANYIKY